MFGLPDSTEVNRVIPKNSFHPYTNTRQKSLFTDLVHRITWLNKLSSDTINLPSKDIAEIQVFLVELKVKSNIDNLLTIMDRAIPYNIIFVVAYEDEVYVSASVKHPHVNNPDNAVIDHTFKGEWMSKELIPFRFDLKDSLDHVFNDFCSQIHSIELGEELSSQEDINKLIEHREVVAKTEAQIKRLRSRMNNTIQYNRKVELNIQIQKLEAKLKKHMT